MCIFWLPNIFNSRLLEDGEKFNKLRHTRKLSPKRMRSTMSNRSGPISSFFSLKFSPNWKTNCSSNGAVVPTISHYDAIHIGFACLKCVWMCLKHTQSPLSYVICTQTRRREHSSISVIFINKTTRIIQLRFAVLRVRTYDTHGDLHTSGVC